MTPRPLLRGFVSCILSPHLWHLSCYGYVLPPAWTLSHAPLLLLFPQTYEGSFKFRCDPQQCIEGNNGLLTHLPLDCAGRSSTKYQEDTETRDKEKASEATGRTPSVVGDLCLPCQVCFWMNENGGNPYKKQLNKGFVICLIHLKTYNLFPPGNLKECKETVLWSGKQMLLIIRSIVIRGLERMILLRNPSPEMFKLHSKQISTVI